VPVGASGRQPPSPHAPREGPLRHLETVLGDEKERGRSPCRALRIPRSRRNSRDRAGQQPPCRSPYPTPAPSAFDAATIPSTYAPPQPEDTIDRRIAVFPLALISACISWTIYHLTSRPHVRLFQHHCDERSWAWPKRSASAQDIIVAGLDACRNGTFVFHYSAAITDDVLTEAAAPLDFRVPQPSTGLLHHPDELIWAALEARPTFERAMHLAPEAVGIFSMPVRRRSRSPSASN
jgi:hypothetical protein